MEPIEMVNEAIAQINNHYPAFLAEVGWDDNDISRYTYYISVHLVVIEAPLPDPEAQELLINEIVIMSGVAFRNIKIEIEKLVQNL